MQHIPRAVEVGGANIFRRIERQRRRSMDDNINTLHRAIDGRAVANIAAYFGNAVFAVLVVERREVERRDRMPALKQVANQVDAEEPGAAGDEETPTAAGRPRDVARTLRLWFRINGHAAHAP